MNQQVNVRELSVRAFSLENKVPRQLPKNIKILEKNKRYFRLNSFATATVEPKQLQTFYIESQEPQPYLEQTINSNETVRRKRQPYDRLKVTQPYWQPVPKLP